MKCSVKGCKKESWYLFMEACYDPSFSKTVLYRTEIFLYTLCSKHDTMFHNSKLGKLLIKPNRKLARKLTIDRRR